MHDKKATIATAMAAAPIKCERVDVSYELFKDLLIIYLIIYLFVY